MKSHKLILSTILLMVIFSVAAQSKENDAISNLRETSKAFASVAKKVSPSVVFIKVESIQKRGQLSPLQTPFGDEFFKRFFGEGFPGVPDQPQSERRVMGQGSGFVFSVNKGLLSSTSYILTNNHVIKDADKIRVTFQDGREFEAKIKGTDPKSDIAILEINSDDYPALAIGDSSKLDVGEWVVAVGNPFGLSHTLTVGVVSATGRSGLGINDYEDFIQTDAAINPGNSGGPLLNLDGEVVGVNTAIFSRSGGYMGIGFAIPVNLAKSIAGQLINSGAVTRGYLGIVIQTMTPELAESMDMKGRKGILVAQVSENSPAKKAGMKVGDLIVAFRGKQVTEISDFRNRVAQTTPGSKVQLTLIRDGKRKSISVKIGNLDEQKVVAEVATQTADELGLLVQTVTQDLARQFNIKAGKGVVVTEVKRGSSAALAGIQTGSVILQVNRIAINSANAFKQAVKKGRSDKRILLLVSNQGMSRYVILNWR